MFSLMWTNMTFILSSGEVKKWVAKLIRRQHAYENWLREVNGKAEGIQLYFSYILYFTSETFFYNFTSEIKHFKIYNLCNQYFSMLEA